MVSVAQKTASNPMSHVAKAMNLDMSSMASKLELPSKLIVPSLDGVSGSILGLGDIAIPGLVISFFYRLPIPRAGLYFW